MLVWFRECLTDQPFGLTSEAYRLDGTQDRIIAALREALAEAEAQLCCRFQIVDAVPDICSPAAEIDRDVPIVGMRDHDARGEHLVESPIKVVPTSSSVAMKVGVIHDPHVALVRAGDNDNIAGP